MLSVIKLSKARETVNFLDGQFKVFADAYLSRNYRMER